MLCGVIVLRGVLVLRVVAATDMAAGPTEAQMDPGVTALEAFLAAVGARLVRLHKVEMAALHFSRGQYL